MPGCRPSETAVTLHPGTAIRVAPRKAARCADAVRSPACSSSGSPYGQVPAWALP